MKLQAYLDLEQIDDAQFAALIRRDRSTVHRLRTGKTKPDWETVALITEATNGSVTALDFVPSPGDPPLPFLAPGGDAENNEAAA